MSGSAPAYRMIELSLLLFRGCNFSVIYAREGGEQGGEQGGSKGGAKEGGGRGETMCF